MALRQRRVDGTVLRTEKGVESREGVDDARQGASKEAVSTPEIEEEQQVHVPEPKQKPTHRRKNTKKNLWKEREQESRLVAEIQRLQEEERKEAARKKLQEQQDTAPNEYFPFQSVEEASKHELALKKTFQKDVSREIEKRAASERKRRQDLARESRPSYEIEPSEMLTQTLDGTASECPCKIIAYAQNALQI